METTTLRFSLPPMVLRLVTSALSFFEIIQLAQCSKAFQQMLQQTESAKFILK